MREWEPNKPISMTIWEADHCHLYILFPSPSRSYYKKKKSNYEHELKAWKNHEITNQTILFYT